MKDAIFLCVDCESTGLDPENDAIIEVGAIRFTLEGELSRFESLIDPGRPIPEESIKIHNITDAMVEGRPKIGAILPALLDFLQEGLLIGHNISFDLSLISTAAAQHDHICDLMERTSVDTLRLARLYGQSPSNALEGLRQHFRIGQERAHRALDDAIVNAEVFRRLVHGFPTRSKLLAALDKPIRMAKMPLGKYKGRVFRDIPLNYLRWASRQNFDGDLLFSIRSELKKRQTGNSFSAKTNPFENLE